MMNIVLRTFILFSALSLKIISAALFQFIQLPTIISLVSTSNYVEQQKNVSSVDDCASLILPTTVALVYNPTLKQCTTWMKINGFNTIMTGNIFYIKMPGKCGQCGNPTEVKRAIMNYTYGNKACPDTFFEYNKNSGYCLAKVSDQVVTSAATYFSNYASYTQGIYRNGTLLVMSRGQAAKALSFTCPFLNSTVSTFNSNWYCYTLFTTPSPSNSYVLDNVCGSLISGGTVIKFIHDAELGYLTVRSGNNAYMGMRYAFPKYVYVDGSAIPSYYLSWATGYPNGMPLVILKPNLQVYSGDSSNMVRLMCRSVATSS